MSKRKNPWDATDYRVGDRIEVQERDGTWTNAIVQKTGGWRLIISFPGGGYAMAINSPNSVRRRTK